MTQLIDVSAANDTVPQFCRKWCIYNLYVV